MKRTLTNHDWAQLCRPIEVQIAKTFNGGFVARFPDANCNASGDSEEDAVENLNDIVAATMELLSSQPEDHLGRASKRQLAVLRECVVAH